MSNLLLNNTMTTQQQQLLLQQQQQQQALNGTPVSNNATSDQSNGSAVAVPDDKDPDSYRLAYQTAINDGRTPDAAAKLAYKNAAPRVNTDEGEQREAGQAGNTGADKQAAQGTASYDASGKTSSANGAASQQKTASTDKANTANGAYVATSAAQDVVDTKNTPSRSYIAVPNGGATDVATGGEPKAKNSSSLMQIADIATDPGTSTRQLQTSQTYTNMVDNDVSPAEAEVAATNTYADLTPSANGDVDAGTVGTIALGDAPKRYLATTAEQKATVAAVTQQLVSNPQLVSTLSQATDQKTIQDSLNRAILDGTLDAMSGTDEQGNKKSSVTGGGSSSKSAKKSVSLNPMELVMVAMMEAAIEGQKQAKSLAEDVQANTDLKRDLREVKSKLGAAIREKGETPGQASSTSSSASTTGGGTSSSSTLNTKELLNLQVSDNTDTNQTNYQSVSDALDSAGDDSSILMIKLQTASQIVTTFLQACSNVSKGVTDTTKAVIGNIGH